MRFPSSLGKHRFIMQLKIGRVPKMVLIFPSSSSSFIQGVNLPEATKLTDLLSKLKHTFVVSDATLPDMPLVFASER